MTHEFRPMPQNPNWCAYYGCTRDKEGHIESDDMYSEAIRYQGERKADNGLGKLTAQDLASIREIILDVLDAGCDCASERHPWELFEGMMNQDHETVTEDTAREQRLRFVNAVQAAIVREAAPALTGSGVTITGSTTDQE